MASPDNSLDHALLVTDSTEHHVVVANQLAFVDVTVGQSYKAAEGNGPRPANEYSGWLGTSQAAKNFIGRCC